jgi:hypothetical protein
MINYLAGIRALTGDVPVRIRVGGNSADISTYLRRVPNVANGCSQQSERDCR